MRQFPSGVLSPLRGLIGFWVANPQLKLRDIICRLCEAEKPAGNRISCAGTPPPASFFLDKIFAGHKVKIVKQNAWAIAPWKNEEPYDEIWQFDRAHNLISIGWSSLGNVTALDEDQIRKKIKTVYPEKTTRQISYIIGQFRLFREIKIGHRIVARRGRRQIAGLGIVFRTHYDDPRKAKESNIDDYDFRNCLSVEWIKDFKPIELRKNVFHQHTVRPVTNPKILKIVEHYFKEEILDSELGDGTLITDIKQIESNKATDPTTKQALISARIGQGKFGSDVREQWNHCCCVTGSSTAAVLEASHIKRWADSNDQERLDPNNGLLLTANLHKLFDAGLISFDASGEMLVSSKLSESEREIFRLVGRSLSKKPLTKTANYLAHHRAKFLK